MANYCRAGIKSLRGTVILNLDADSMFYAVLNCDSFLENFIKPLLSLYGTEWRERGYGLWSTEPPTGRNVFEKKLQL